MGLDGSDIKNKKRRQEEENTALEAREAKKEEKRNLKLRAKQQKEEEEQQRLVDAQKSLKFAAQKRQKSQDNKKAERVKSALEGEVIIKGVDIPFMDLVLLILKFTLASIPVAIGLAIAIPLWTVMFGGFISAIFGGFK